MAYDVVAILPLRLLLWKTLKSRHNGFVRLVFQLVPVKA